MSRGAGGIRTGAIRRPRDPTGCPLAPPELYASLGNTPSDPGRAEMPRYSLPVKESWRQAS